jgi:TPR repeat protein
MSMKTRWLKPGWMAAVLLSLIAAPAAAGPEQDVELADQIFSATEDLPRAMKLLENAAGQGYAPAQVRLGYLLDKAEFNEASVEWYRKAAEQGHAGGEYGLGYMYAIGEGVEKDVEQARTWIMRAAEKNHLPSVVMLAEAYKNGGLGLPQDMEQSLFWENKAQAIREAEKAVPEQEKKGYIGETR